MAGLAFACHQGFTPQDYARYLWAKGSVRWMGKPTPKASEYLLKEVQAFKEFYPGVSFEMVEAGDERAELLFTDGCLGGWGEAPWSLARSLGLSKKDVCAYCGESFRVWAGQLGLYVDIGPQDDKSCRLVVLSN